MQNRILVINEEVRKIEEELKKPLFFKRIEEISTQLGEFQTQNDVESKIIKEDATFASELTHGLSLEQPLLGEFKNEEFSSEQLKNKIQMLLNWLVHINKNEHLLVRHLVHEEKEYRGSSFEKRFANHLLQQIFNFLTMPERAAAKSVSKRFYESVNDSLVSDAFIPLWKVGQHRLIYPGIKPNEQPVRYSIMRERIRRGFNKAVIQNLVNIVAEEKRVELHAITDVSNGRCKKINKLGLLLALLSVALFLILLIVDAAKEPPSFEIDDRLTACMSVGASMMILGLFIIACNRRDPSFGCLPFFAERRARQQMQARVASLAPARVSSHSMFSARASSVELQEVVVDGVKNEVKNAVIPRRRESIPNVAP